MSRTEPNLTPEQRTMRARLAAHALHASRDSRELTKAATFASMVTRFEREVDPDGQLDPDERRRRAVQARKAYMTRMGYASSLARAERKAARLAAQPPSEAPV